MQTPQKIFSQLIITDNEMPNAEISEEGTFKVVKGSLFPIVPEQTNALFCLFHSLVTKAVSLGLTGANLTQFFLKWSILL